MILDKPFFEIYSAVLLSIFFVILLLACKDFLLTNQQLKMANNANNKRQLPNGGSRWINIPTKKKQVE